MPNAFVSLVSFVREEYRENGFEDHARTEPTEATKEEVILDRAECLRELGELRARRIS